MLVKIYLKNKENNIAQLLESVDQNTKIVKVKSSEYDVIDPIERDVDVEGKIICGKEYIMSHPEKVVGIIDCELAFAQYYRMDVRDGEIVEFDSNRFIKTPCGYKPVEFEAD